MPRALRTCNRHGCPESVPSGYCTAHQPPPAYQQGYTRHWKRCSLIYRRQNPLCVHCQAKGITTPAKAVDHIIPHRGDMELFWDTSNWQSLCSPCHAIKTNSEDGGFGNARRVSA